MPALKCLSKNSYISVVLVLASTASFFFPFEIFLVSAISSWNPDICILYWDFGSYVNFLFLLAFSDTTPVGSEGCCLVTAKWVQVQGPHLPSIEACGWGTAFRCWVGVGVLVTPLTTQDRRALVTAVRDESPHSLFGLLWLHPGSPLGTSLQPCEGGSWAPHMVFAHVVRVRLQFFLWCMAGVECFLYKDVLSFSAVPFLILCLGNAGFHWAFFLVCACWHSWITSIFCLKSEIFQMRIYSELTMMSLLKAESP